MNAICVYPECRLPSVDHDLCLWHWIELPTQTRARLRQRDHDAHGRRLELLAAIASGVPLQRITVAA